MPAMIKEDTFIVEVGLEKKWYRVHKSLIAKHSEYFRAASSGPWKEAEDGKVVLGDVESTACE